MISDDRHEDGSLSAHEEYTIGVLKTGPIVLTGPPETEEEKKRSKCSLIVMNVINDVGLRKYKKDKMKFDENQRNPCGINSA